jgi:ATP-dependent RNA helicase RhlB
MEFSELNLNQDLQRGIAEAGYITCMSVQEQVLTHAFNGQDLYVQSQTGTGKTAAFLVVIFQRLLTEDLLAGKKAIIMVPTRELAVQVEEEAKVLAKYLPFKIGSFYGGVGYTQQEKMLRENVQILVGTPGRVLDLNKSGKMNLMEIAFLVLDEADRMFDMGFYPDLRKLIRVIPPADRRQTMLFSATLNAWVKNLAWEYTKTPYEIEIEPETVTVQEIEQVLYHVPSEDKMRLLLGILEREKPESALIFCNTTRYTEIIAKRLEINGYECEFIIGDLPQAKRLKVIDDVKAGKVHFLVATDVAARGLDIDNLAMVINYDLPVEAENYVHRTGRTARAGKTGKAITLASEQDVYELPDIERYIGKKIPSEIASEVLYGEDKSAGMRIRTEFFGSGFGGGRSDSRSGRSDGRRDTRRDSRGDSRRDSRDDSRRDSRDDSRDNDSRARFGAARGDGRRSEGRPGEGRSGEGRRDDRRDSRSGDSRRPQADSGRSDRPRNEAPSQDNRREVRGSEAPGQAREGEGLEQLSFEQRQAYYKQKYDSAGSAQDGGSRRQGSRSEGRGKEPGRGRDNAPRDGAAPGDRPQRRRPDKPANQGQNAGRNKAPNQGGKAGPAEGSARAKPQAAPSQNSPAEAAKKPGILNRFLGIFKKK